LVLGDSSDEFEDKNPSLKSLPLSIPLLYFSHGCKNANVSKSLDTCFLNLQPPHATALSEPERDGHPSNQPRRPGAIYVFLFFF
jgi:hypothetical protein